MSSPYVIIKKKRDGYSLSAGEIESFVSAYVSGDIPDYQMSAFLMAVFFRGMNAEETAALVSAMIRSGDSIDPDSLGTPTADKHSTGGVGDKISLVLAPLAAAAGLRVPMMSGRGLGHTGGTLDKLESIPGFNTRLDKNRMLRQIDDIGVAMIGQSDRMVPADKKMYALRDVTATVDCIPLIAASIMSKKIASGPRNLVLDVKVGRGAFMQSVEDAMALARTMTDIGVFHGRRMLAILTDMHTQPLGNAVGNSLEVIESVEVLKGGGPRDIRELTLVLTSAMLTLAGIEPDEKTAVKKLAALLDNGKAFEKFVELVKAQNGDPKALEPGGLKRAPVIETVKAERDGYIAGIDPMIIGLAGIELGGGRMRREDEIDHRVGFYFHARTGDSVRPGDALVDIHAAKTVDKAFIRKIMAAFEWSENPVSPPVLIIDRISPRGR